jgi:hypothetical protein
MTPVVRQGRIKTGRAMAIETGAKLVRGFSARTIGSAPRFSPRQQSGIEQQSGVETLAEICASEQQGRRNGIPIPESRAPAIRRTTRRRITPEMLHPGAGYKLSLSRLMPGTPVDEPQVPGNSDEVMLRGFFPARISLRFSARRVALRCRRGDLVRCRNSALGAGSTDAAPGRLNGIQEGEPIDRCRGALHGRPPKGLHALRFLRRSSAFLAVLAGDLADALDAEF